MCVLVHVFERLAVLVYDGPETLVGSRKTILVKRSASYVPTRLSLPS